MPGRLAVFASFFIHFLFLGNVSSFVILYVYLQRDFHASETETGWAGSITWAAMNLLAPLASALYVRIGCQRVILIGVLIASLGLLLTSFATELWLVYITYGLMFGAGSNFAFTATLNVITEYYPGENNLRATSMASCGQPLGLLVISASLERACFFLGWRNGIRIVSGFTLVFGVICTILSKPYQSPKQLSTPNSSDEECPSKPGTSSNELTADGKVVSNGVTPSAEQSPGDDKPPTSRVVRGKNYKAVPFKDEGEVIADVDNSRHHHLTENPPPQSLNGSPHAYSSHFKISAKNRLDFLRSSEGHHRSLTRLNFPDAKTDTNLIPAMSSSTPCLSSVNRELLHDHHQRFPISWEHWRDESCVDDPEEFVSFTRRYLRLLRLPGHWFFFIGIVSSSLAALFNVIHLVKFAVSIDISEKTASNLLIGMAGMEIVARLPFIIFGNRLSVNRNIVIAVACVMGAFATYALAMWASLHIMIVYVIVLGAVRGILYGVCCGATIDTFGSDRALESYTSLLISFGLAGGMVSTVGGISTDITGSFTISLHIIAALFLLSALLFICTYVWRRRNPLIGQQEHVTCDVNANKSGDAKDAGQLATNGTSSTGETV
ncbi:uncharacterized protein LOC117304872 [Asterias rubens]|uniref:uncharacterized protein LOC117304872 n=1 Tax=Asterias rubens TaxID=7604 RepID=UPI0014551D3E|nr:uncharacterized protein LOC117304872 [Asterias rubens]